MPQPPEDEPFFARWSKRKRQADDTPQPAALPEEPDAPEDSDSISEEDLAALPSLEEFTPQTDIRQFLRKGVPQPLRNAALRKMWLLTPAIRDHKDPAVDYAWDWNTPGGVPGAGEAASPERAAQMLRDLVNPRRDAEPPKDHDTNEIAAPEVATERPDSAPQQGQDQDNFPAEEPETDPVQLAFSVPDKSEEKQSTNDLPPPRKRHGGALPG